MNSTTPPPAIRGADAAIGYVLVPFFLITIVGIVVAVVSLFGTQGKISWDRREYSQLFFLFQIMYIRKRKRWDARSFH